MNAVFDHEADASLLGARLQDGHARRHIATLKTTDFDDTQAQAAYAAIEALHASHAAVDLRTVTDEAARLSGRDVLGYLLECSRKCPTAANADAYHRIVAEHSRRRTLYQTLRGQADQLLNPMNDAETIVEAVRAGLSQGRANGKLISLSDAIMEAYEGIERAAKGETEALATGIPDLDWLTGGLYPGELTILGARPGVGKSSLALDIALNIAADGHRVLVDTLEMTSKQYAQRIIARGSGVNLRDIRHGSIRADAQWVALGDAANAGSKLPVHFTADVRTPEGLRALAEATSPELIVVDYLQLMETRRRADNETVRLGKISAGLKELTLECGVPVLAIAQVTRTEGRAMVMPILKELRGSGNLEQDADNVIFMHQPESAADPYIRREDAGLFKLLADQPGRRYVVINAAKQRQGELGVFPMIFEPARMRFTAVSRQAQAG